MRSKTFAIPTILALLSAAGLVTALVGDGPWDWLSWVLVSLPLLAIVASLKGSREV
jgi:hypothetical protein